MAQLRIVTGRPAVSAIVRYAGLSSSTLNLCAVVGAAGWGGGSWWPLPALHSTGAISKACLEGQDPSGKDSLSAEEKDLRGKGEWLPVL